MQGLLILIALVLGAGGAWFLRGEAPAPVVTGNQAEIERLTAQIEALSRSVEESAQAQAEAQATPAPATPDPAVAELQAAISGQIEGLGGSLKGLSDKLAAVDERMAQIETRPADSSPDVTEALSSLTGDLDTARTDVASLTAERASLEGKLAELTAERDALRADLDAAKAEIAALGDRLSAAEPERQAAALTLFRSAVMSGEPYTEAAATFEERTGKALQPALSASAAKGVPTLAQLGASFPDAARAGLTASLTTKHEAPPQERALDFLRAQIGLRSITPREGDDADAVLSRAEAAVHAGDLAAALAEIEKLPDAGQEAMAGWTTAARVHMDAVAALQELSGS